jgi:hypothetical protein
MSAYDASGLERVPFGAPRAVNLMAHPFGRSTPSEESPEDHRRSVPNELPACPKCGECPIDFSVPCPSCWTDWAPMIGGAR